MTAIFDQGPPPPCPSPFNLAAYVLGAGAATPDKTALSILGLAQAEHWSYARLIAAVRGTATGFLTQNVAPGDRVLMRLGNSPAFPIAFLAAITAGLIPVPCSALLTGSEITKIAAEVQPALIIAQDGISLPDPVRCPVIDIGAMIAMGDLPPAPYQLGDPNRPAYIVYTSGTSGYPRAVTHAHRAVWARRMMWHGWYGLTVEDRMLHAGAFNWTYTMGTGLLDPWTRGATALIPGAGVTPADLPDMMKRHDATIFAAAPGIYRQMLRAAFPVLPHLRHGLSAGEKLPSTTRDGWEDATGTPIHEAFGMSECSTFISGSPIRPVSGAALGIPQNGRRIAVMEDGMPTEFDAPGELALSTCDPGLMLGYWNGVIGAPVPVSGDWFFTGDQVSLSAAGKVQYLGRRDDMMNAGGVRVSPIEVETVMNAHPQITECAAVEYAIKADTSIIALFYVSALDLDPEQLRTFAGQQLAPYKTPRQFQRIDALPKGANGKLMRSPLRNYSPLSDPCPSGHGSNPPSSGS